MSITVNQAAIQRPADDWDEATTELAASSCGSNHQTRIALLVAVPARAGQTARDTQDRPLVAAVKARPNLPNPIDAAAVRFQSRAALQTSQLQRATTDSTQNTVRDQVAWAGTLFQWHNLNCWRVQWVVTVTVKGCAVQRYFRHSVGLAGWSQLVVTGYVSPAAQAWCDQTRTYVGTVRIDRTVEVGDWSEGLAVRFALGVRDAEVERGAVNEVWL